MGGLLRGIGDARRGAGFLAARPRLWRWVAAPFALTLGLLVALIALAVRYLGPAIDRWLADLPGFLAWMSTALTVLVALAVLAFGYFAFVAAAMALSAPFNEMLSEEVEAIVTGVPAPPTSPGAMVIDVLVGLVHGLRRVAGYLVWMALLFLLSNLVPVLGHGVALLIGGLITARYAAWDAYDAVLARRRLTYAAKRETLAGLRGRAFGLGASVAGLLLVPGLNLVALPIGAVGATLGYLDQHPAPAAARASRG